MAKTPDDDRPFGEGLYLLSLEKLDAVEKKHEAHFTWVQEVLAEAKRTFSSQEIELLPKTPSVKRTRQMRKAESDDDEQIHPASKKRPKQIRKTKKAEGNDSETGVDSGNSARSTRSTRSTRATRSTKPKKQKDVEPMTAPPNMRLEDVIGQLDYTEESNDDKLQLPKPVPELQREVPPSPKPRTPLRAKTPASPSNSPARPAKPSPKPIPGFTGLNVKAKATAYEEYVASPQKGTNVSVTEECPSPRKRNALCRVLDSLRKSNSPRKQVSPVRGGQSTPTHETQPQKNNRGTITISHVEENQSHSDSPVPDKEESGEMDDKSHRRSSRRSSRVISKPTGVRMSLSQRRSSIMRHKVRSSIQNQNRSSSIRRTPSKLRKPTPAPTTLGDGQVEDVVMSDVDGAHPVAMQVSSDELPEKSAASPTRKPKTSNKEEATSAAECDADVEDETDTPNTRTPVPVPRATRSKMRLNKPAPPVLPVGSSEDEPTPGQKGTTSAPSRSTRSKMRVNKPPPPRLQSPSSEDEPSSEAPRATRSKVNRTDSPSLKRLQKDRADNPSPPKKQCLDEDVADENSDEFVDKTPSPPCPRSKVIRGQANLQTTSFLSQLKKTVTTPSSVGTTITSFIKRNTPMKHTAHDRENQKRREVEAKKEATEQRLNRRQELLHQRAEEQRKRREERQALAARRREQNQKKTMDSRNEVQLKIDEKRDLKARLHEERLREERERQKLREKKLAVAEVRRKQEEDARLQKLRESEMEAKRQEEVLQRKREFEEAERQKRIADQRRLEEERRQEAVRERQREMERLHRDALDKQKREAEERRQREDELRRERQEREKRELEEKREREKQRMAELDKIREKERVRLQTESAAQAAQAEEERKARDAIRKHNSSVLQQNTSLANASNTQPAKTGLNTTITKEPVSESYEMTPTKPVKKNQQNYDIDNLHSDDETDDEDMPKRVPPAWATGSNLKAAMINQHYHPPNLDTIFPMIEMPDLNTLFKRKKPRFNKRTSSACWDSPILKHAEAHYSS